MFSLGFWGPVEALPSPELTKTPPIHKHSELIYRVGLVRLSFSPPNTVN